MKLGRTYDYEDYDEAITVVSPRHEERLREIEHKMRIDKAGARRTYTRERTLPSLGLQIIHTIDRSLMMKDKRRHRVRNLPSPKTRTIQSRRPITRKNP
jgi:hypothetical protein